MSASICNDKCVITWSCIDITIGDGPKHCCQKQSKLPMKKNPPHKNVVNKPQGLKSFFTFDHV